MSKDQQLGLYCAIAGTVLGALTFVIGLWSPSLQVVISAVIIGLLPVVIALDVIRRKRSQKPSPSGHESAWKKLHWGHYCSVTAIVMGMSAMAIGYRSLPLANVIGSMIVGLLVVALVIYFVTRIMRSRTHSPSSEKSETPGTDGPST